MKFQTDSLGNYIKEHKEKNKDLIETNLLGVTISKKFIPSIANTNGTNFKNYKIISYNDFVYGPVTSRNGDKISIALFKEDSSIVSQSYKVFSIIDENLLNPDFLMLWFEREEFDRYARFHSHGSTREVFTWKKLCDTEIPVPDIENQDKIVQINETILKRIKIKEKLNNNLEQLAESIFKNWFINCEPFVEENFIEHVWTNFPESWTLIKLKDIINITSGKRPGDKEDLKKGEFIYPLYGASSIMGYVSKYSYNEPILLIGRVGTLGIVQRVIDKCHPSDNTLVIKSTYYEYVFQILKRINYDAYNTGSTQPLITQKAISNIEIPLPPSNELDKFEKISSTIYSEVYKNNNEIETLTKLRDTLLPKLMSGEIDVSEINFDL